MTDEWIEHHGKGYPDLPMDTLVQVRFADGEPEYGEPCDVAYWEVNWVHDERGARKGDITHYRVVKP